MWTGDEEKLEPQEPYLDMCDDEGRDPLPGECRNCLSAKGDKADCYNCGEHLCSECKAGEREDRDPDTGYRGTEYYCAECMEKMAEMEK